MRTKKVILWVHCILIAAWALSRPVCGIADTFNANPIADSFVAFGPTGNLAGNNYGGGGALAVAAPNLPNGEFQTVLEFDLSSTRNALNAEFGAGLWTIQSVTLQLSSSPHNNAIYNNIAAGKFNVSLMQNNSWVEGTGTAGLPTTDGISFNSLQNTFINSATDQSLGIFSFPGGSSGANSYSLNLSPGIIADLLAGDDLSLRLSAADNTVSYLFSSRSASPASIEPTLIINAVPEPSTITLSLLAAVSAFLFWRFSRRTLASECNEKS